MNVEELMDELSKMPKKIEVCIGGIEVCIGGYEGGLEIVDHVSKICVEKDVNAVSWLGPHEDRTADVTDGSFPVEKTCKMVLLN